jgi:hypothetical protein
MYNTHFRRYNRNYKMSAQYNKDTMINVNTLCIPRVFPNIRENRIRGVIASLKMCDIEKIDMVSRVGEKGEKYNRVFIHISKWHNTENAQSAQNRLSVGKDIKIVYDDPWFWKVSAYRKTLPVKSSRSVKQPPHIVFDEEEVEPRSKVFQPRSPMGPPPPIDTSVSQMIAEEMLDREYDASVGSVLNYGPASKAIPKKKVRRPTLAVSPVKPLSIRNPDDMS